MVFYLPDMFITEESLEKRKGTLKGG